MSDIPGNRTACNNNMNITKLVYLVTDVSIDSLYFQTQIYLKYKISSISPNYKFKHTVLTLNCFLIYKPFWIYIHVPY